MLLFVVVIILTRLQKRLVVAPLQTDDAVNLADSALESAADPFQPPSYCQCSLRADSGNDPSDSASDNVKNSVQPIPCAPFHRVPPSCNQLPDILSVVLLLL